MIVPSACVMTVKLRRSLPVDTNRFGGIVESIGSFAALCASAVASFEVLASAEVVGVPVTSAANALANVTSENDLRFIVPLPMSPAT